MGRRRSWWCGAALVALAACGGGDGGATPDTGGPTAAPPTSPVPSAAAATAERPGSSPGTEPATSPPRTGVAPQGFDRIAARVTAADGTTCDVCLWSAATPAQRMQGLMGVTDLSGADGMVFRWTEPTSGQFWMRDTPLPLSIAFFAADGSFVSSADMVPCLDRPADACPRYGAAGPYTAAVEVAAGGLAALSIGPGSRLELFDRGCPPDAG